MRHKKRNIFLMVLALFVILLTGAVYYLNRYFLPGQAKQIIVAKAEEFLKRKVTLEGIHFNFVKGFSLSKLTIYEKDSSEMPFLYIDEIHFSLLYAPLFQNKKIIIPSAAIRQPAVHIVRLKDNEWNFSDLLPAKEARGKEKNHFDLLLGGLNITNGQIKFTDLSHQSEAAGTATAPFTETLEAIYLKASLSAKKNITYSLEAKVTGSPAEISLKGDYELSNQKLSVHLNLANAALEKYIPFYCTTPGRQFKKGLLKFLDITGSFNDNRLDLKGSLLLSGMNIIMGDQKISGDIRTSQSTVILKGQELIFKTDGDAVAQVIWGGDKDIKANLHTDAVKLTKINGIINLEGGIEIKGLLANPAPDTKFTTDVKINHALLSFDKGVLKINTDLRLSSLQSQLGIDKKFAGTLDIPQLRLTSVNGQTTVLGDPELNGINFKMGAQELTTNVKATAAALIFKKNTVDFKGDFAFQEMRTKMGPQEFAGNPALSVRVNYNPDGAIPLEYQGTINPNKAGFKGLPYIGEIRDIDGTIEFSTNLLRFPSLKLIARDIPMVISGKLNDFAKPYLDIQATIDQLNLEEVYEEAGRLAPEMTAKFPAQVSGQAALTASIRGPAFNLEDAKINVAADLKKASVRSAKLPAPIEEISGKISYSPDLLSWENLQGKFQKETYALTGSLRNFDRPQIQTSLASANLNLNTRITIAENAYEIASLAGNYFHSAFDLSGTIRAPDNTEPFFNITGHLNADLGDLNQIRPDLAPQLQDLNPKGKIIADAVFKGKPSDWRNWQLNLKAQSPKLAIRGLRLTDVNLILEEKDRRVERCDLTALFYNGPLAVYSAADLSNEAMPFRINGKLENASLNQLKNDTPLAKEEISGLISALLSLKGKLQDIKKLEGEGTITVTDGQLWQLNLFKGIGKLLFIPEFSNITFTHALAEFTVQNEQLKASNIILESKAVTLKGSGQVNFDGKINFNINSEFHPEAIAESSSVKRAVTAILTQTENYLTIKITGSLKEPKYSATSTPANMLEKTRDLIKEGLQSIF